MYLLKTFPKKKNYLNLKKKKKKFKMIWFLLILNLLLKQPYFSESCVSYICINSCGLGQDRGYKLILLNNRDEDLNRLTKPTSFWPPRQTIHTHSPGDEHDKKVYGPLDIQRGFPPYSTWLAINEYGNVGSLLFYIQDDRSNKDKKPRGTIVADFLLNNSINYNNDAFMKDFEATKFLYKAFNLVLLEMSEKNGNYSIYYLNNNNTDEFKKMNENENEKFVFSISNSEPQHPFRKVIEGEKMFENILSDYSKLLIAKEEFIDSLFNQILFNNTPLYPDENLARYFKRAMNDENKMQLANISSINSKYFNLTGFEARTRTSTLILVDFDNQVEYYEFNLTLQGSMDSWSSSNHTFKLKPLYTRSNVKIVRSEVKSIFFEFLLITLGLSLISNF
jgi:uncharacterized protein with NRDE domain